MFAKGFNDSIYYTVIDIQRQTYCHHKSLLEQYLDVAYDAYITACMFRLATIFGSACSVEIEMITTEIKCFK